MSNKKIFFIVFSLLWTCSIFASELPDFTARYTFEKHGTKLGYTTYKLKNESNGEQVFTLNTELTGLAAFFLDDRIEETSILKLNDSVLLLNHYRYIHHGSRDNKNIDVLVNWKKNDAGKFEGLLSGTARGKQVNEKVSSGLRDSLSFQLSLMNDLQNNKADLTYKVFNKGEVKTYKFIILSEEKIKHKKSSLPVVKIMRDHGHNKVTFLWLDKTNHYLPIKVERFEDNELDSRMTLDQVSFTRVNKDG